MFGLSGSPKVFRGTAVEESAATIQQATILRGVQTTWFKIQNRGGNVIKVFFTQADFEADVNFCEVAGGASEDFPVQLGSGNNLIGLYLVAQGADSDFTLLYGERL